MPRANVYEFLGKADLDWVLGGPDSLEQLIQQYPDSRTDLQNAYAKFIDRKYAEAAQYFEKICQKFPNVDAYMYGLILSHLPNNPSKVQTFLSKTKSDSAAYHYLHGLYLEGYAITVNDWNHIMGSPDQWKKEYPQAQTELQTAMAAFIEHRYSDATRALYKAYERYPHSDYMVNAIILSLIPYDFAKLKQFWPQKANAQNPNYTFLQHCIHDWRTETRQAAEAYQIALTKNSNFVPALFRLGYHINILAEEADSLPLYEQAVQNNTVYINLLLNLGIFYEDSNQYAKAVQCYEQILKSYPSHTLAMLYLKDAQSSLEMFVDEEKEREQDKQNQILATPISDFELSVRSKHCLERMRIRTLGDLVKKTETELLSYKNFGDTSLGEIKTILAKKGLKLGMDKEEEEVAKHREKKTTKTIKVPNNEEVMAIAIATLDLSSRCRRCLVTLNVQTIADLVQKTEKELLSCKNFGQTSMSELKTKLNELGVHLREEE